MKGQILTWTSVGFFIMSVIFLLPHLYQFLITNQYPGATSITLLNAHYDAQEKLLFIDQAGRYSLHDALRDLALQGGFAKPSESCGQHSYYLWSTTDPTQNCLPDEKKTFEAIYPLLFESYLSQTLYPYPKDNYNYAYSYDLGLQVLAKAKNNLITQSEFNGKHFADYLVKPSYRVNYPHTLNVYERVKQWAQETLEHCYDDPQRCLNEAVQEHNEAEDVTQSDAFTLSTDCPESFDNFAERYQDCAWTAQTDCLCSIPLDTKQKTKIELKSDRITLLQPYYQEYAALTPIALGSYAGNQDPANRYTLENDGEKTTLTAYKDTLEIKKVENYPSLLLYKGKEEITVLQEPVYASGEPVPLCTFNKTRSKLCARTNHELPYIKPGSVEWKNVVIQFALELQDLTPALPYYSAKDKPSILPQLSPPTGSELSEGILIQWDQPQYEDSRMVEDIDHYLIYCSKGEFSDERIPTYALVFDDRKSVHYYTGEKTVSTPVLQRIGDENRYTITLQGCGSEEIHDDPKAVESLYQVYVTPVDKNGNEPKENIQPAEVCPSSYYLEHPPTIDLTGVLMAEYEFYLTTVRRECWPRT
ncbi:MAG TPA: hypothetical protein VJG90_02155 [Candidatus Nanoarchaeia archaeon]|nr:hypothetical protein [Candidatus Nanoarchaeia archaeon]